MSLCPFWQANINAVVPESSCALNSMLFLIGQETIGQYLCVHESKQTSMQFVQGYILHPIQFLGGCEAIEQHLCAQFVHGYFLHLIQFLRS